MAKTGKKRSAPTSTSKGRVPPRPKQIEAKPVQPARPEFIVTQSTAPDDTERQANAAFLERCVQAQGFVRLRLEARVYDPHSKRYMNLIGESINVNVFSRVGVEQLLAGLRDALVEEENRVKRA